MADEAKDVEANDRSVKYPHNVLEGFANGCLLDLRVRLAIEFLKGGVISVTEARPAAHVALDLANELMAEAERRGWVEPLPEDAVLNSAVKKQARRTGVFGATQQIEGQGVMQDEARGVSPVSPVSPVFPPFGGRGRN